MKRQLIQLPICGDWVDPATITAVIFYEGKKYRDGEETLPRVVVERGSDRHVINCECGVEQAMRIREEIGAVASLALQNLGDA